MKLSSSRFDMETARLERPTLKNYAETVVGGALGTNATVIQNINLSSGNIHPVTLSAPGTVLNFVNPPATGTSGNFTLIVKQDSTGGRTIVWPESVYWANGTEPTLTATASAVDIFSFFTVNGGSTWQGCLSLANTHKKRTLWSAGRGVYGRLGDGTQSSRSSPTQVGALTNWASVSGGGYHSLATKTNGTLWAFGQNSFGQLGDGTTTQRVSPVQVGSLTNWASVACGYYHSLATKTDGTLWSFGQNTAYAAGGQLGDGTTVNRSSPVQIGSLTDWASVAGGKTHSLAIKTNGTLWGFGGNSEGARGDGGGNKSSPIQVGSLTNWARVSCGYRHSVAVKTDGTLWSFGRNSEGQLGDGTTTQRVSPVQVGSLTNWASASAHGWTSGHSLATKTDGTLWSWGQGGSGRLGDGTVVSKSSPIQVGSLTNWASVATCSVHSIAVKTDGTLWSFGDNSQGFLFDDTVVSKSSPIQVGTDTNWANVAGGVHHSFAMRKN